MYYPVAGLVVFGAMLVCVLRVLDKRVFNRAVVLMFEEWTVVSFKFGLDSAKIMEFKHARSGQTVKFEFVQGHEDYNELIEELVGQTVCFKYVRNPFQNKYPHHGSYMKPFRFEDYLLVRKHQSSALLGSKTA